MGEGIAHIISPLSAPWCGWVMLGLLFCGILSEYFQPGVITQSTDSLRVRAERSYKDSPTNFFGQVYLNLFRVGTLAMLLCLCFSPAGEFSFLTYLAVNGVILAVMIVKMLCNVIIDYTFQLSRRFGAVYEHYSNIATMTGLLLWPVLLVLLHVGDTVVNRWALGITALLFLVLWIYRSAAQYIKSPMAIGYMLIYWCTLEMLPLAAIIYVSEKTISIL